MGSRMANKLIWAEMARRKVQFHKTDNWQTIKLWGLFHWGAVSHLLKSGQLITHMKKENGLIWVRPTNDSYEGKIKPLIENHSLEELTEMAGWGTYTPSVERSKVFF